MFLQLFLSDEFLATIFTAVPLPVRHHRIAGWLFPPSRVPAGIFVVQQVLPQAEDIAVSCVAKSAHELVSLAGVFVIFEGVGIRQEFETF